MAASLLLRPLPLLRLCIVQLRHHFWFDDRTISSRHLCSSVADGAGITAKPSIAQLLISKAAKDTGHYWRCDDPDYRKWKNKEAEIFKDIGPIVTLTKDILHSDRYMDGAHLTPEDKKAVVDKLLAHHPHSKDKMGCGLDSIMLSRKSPLLMLSFCHAFRCVMLAVMSVFQPIRNVSDVDRHPQFGQSRCLFVVRTDGGWIDFSYQKCLRAYLQDKYPSHADRFIKEHLKR